MIRVGDTIDLMGILLNPKLNLSNMKVLSIKKGIARVGKSYKHPSVHIPVEKLES